MKKLTDLAIFAVLAVLLIILAASTETVYDAGADALGASYTN